MAERFPGGDFGEAEVLPIIEACPADTFFVDLEGRWLDDPKHRTGGDAGPADVPRILWDLGLVKYHMCQPIRHQRFPRRAVVMASVNSRVFFTHADRSYLS